MAACVLKMDDTSLNELIRADRRLCAECVLSAGLVAFAQLMIEPEAPPHSKRRMIVQMLKRCVEDADDPERFVNSVDERIQLNFPELVAPKKPEPRDLTALNELLA